MNNVILFIRKLNWQRSVLIFSIFAVVTAYIFRLLTPTQVAVQPTVLTNAFKIESELNNISYTGKAVSVPEKMPTAELSNYVENATSVKETLVNKYNLIKSSEQGEIWTNDDYILSVLENPNLIIITQSSRSNETQQSASEFSTGVLETIKQNTNQLVKELYPDNPPQILENQITFLGPNDEEFLPVAAQDANFIIIPYTYQINGVPIYFDQELNYVAYFVYDTNQGLISAELRPYQIEFKLEKNYKTLNMPLAMSNVNNNNAAIIYTDALGVNGGAPLISQSGDMSSAVIEYRVDPINDTLSPYYRLTGELILSNQYELNTQIITPAIQTNFETSE